MKIGISGLSGSGKTFISGKLSEISESVLLSQDDYYFGCDLVDIGKGYDFDTLAAVDLEQLKLDVKNLGLGHNILKPIYCFKKHMRISKELIEPKKNIIVEGNLVFLDEDMFDSFDLVIYVDVPSELALLRRLKRDQIERGRDSVEVIESYENYVRKNNTAIEGLRQKSHLIVNNQFKEHQTDLILNLLGTAIGQK